MKKLVYLVALIGLVGFGLLRGCSQQTSSPPAAPATNAPAQ
jgi:hypothetical protein